MAATTRLSVRVTFWRNPNVDGCETSLHAFQPFPYLTADTVNLCWCFVKILKRSLWNIWFNVTQILQQRTKYVNVYFNLGNKNKIELTKVAVKVVNKKCFTLISQQQSAAHPHTHNPQLLWSVAQSASTQAISLAKICIQISARHSVQFVEL